MTSLENIDAKIHKELENDKRLDLLFKKPIPISVTAASCLNQLKFTESTQVISVNIAPIQRAINRPLFNKTPQRRFSPSAFALEIKGGRILNIPTPMILTVKKIVLLNPTAATAALLTLPTMILSAIPIKT